MHIEFNQDDIERILMLVVQQRGFQVRNVLIEPVYDKDEEYMGVTAQVDVCDNSFDPKRNLKPILEPILDMAADETEEPQQKDEE